MTLSLHAQPWARGPVRVTFAWHQKNWSLPEFAALAVVCAAELVPPEVGSVQVREGRGSGVFRGGVTKASGTASVCQRGNSLAFRVLVTLQRNCSWVSRQRSSSAESIKLHSVNGGGSPGARARWLAPCSHPLPAPLHTGRARCL